MCMKDSFTIDNMYARLIYDRQYYRVSDVCLTQNKQCWLIYHENKLHLDVRMCMLFTCGNHLHSGIISLREKFGPIKLKLKPVTFHCNVCINPG